MTGRAKTIAVDFDGTLCENRFPEIGRERPGVVEYVKKRAAEGAKIILHTCRENGARRALLDEALLWCVERDIPIYAVNENPDNDYGERFGVAGAGRKVYADLYIDDKAINAADVEQGATMPERYLIHCEVKGWKPSPIGYEAFVRLCAMGYYWNVFAG